MKIRVLFLAADPSNLPELGLKQEVAQINQNLQASDFGDQIEIVPHWSTKPDDLIQLLNQDDDWEIVRFSGHGSEAHQLLFVDEFGNSKPVSKEALQRLFGSLGRKARVAIFNACSAQEQAEAVTQHIDCAIGMSKAIGDEAAIRY
ncbi:MAG: CHAT domain-containing protein [Gammaproteobacteria bacterium]|nr:CHAT domain-containing protein [Gammaproteobacteria bacterium]